MTEGTHLPPHHPTNCSKASAPEPEGDEFYARAYIRMMRYMLVVAIIAAPLLFWRWGWQLSAGFVLGGLMALLNFRWLERTVYGLSELILQNPDRPPSGRVVRRFLLRYFLIAIAAYVILKSLNTAVYGFFVGLSLPVVGVFCEAAYELFIVLKSRS